MPYLKHFCLLLVTLENFRFGVKSGVKWGQVLGSKLIVHFVKNVHYVACLVANGTRCGMLASNGSDPRPPAKDVREF
jgi:hypothetical protein